METNERTEVGSVAQVTAEEHALGRPHDLMVTARVLPGGAPTKFKIADNAPLLQLLEDGARHLGVHLLPSPPLRPLDRLHNIVKHDDVGPPIGDLDQSVGKYLEERRTTKDFGIELVLAFRVNTRWAVATKPQMTPREIMTLPAINLDPTQYTLYLPESAKPLPLDHPVPITRGGAFEAQRDGKYGGAPDMFPAAVKDEVEMLSHRGVPIELVAAGGQCYALARGIDAPAPGWDRASYDIVVAVPAAYDAAALDAFYLALPYTFNGSTHPRVQGATVTVDGREWRLVSWHYPDGKSWTRGLDDLASHLTHCKGFFLHRGAINDYR